MPIQVAPIPAFQYRVGFPFLKREPRVTPSAFLGARFTEFYCQANGSNLNAGSTQDAAAIYTSTNGNWSTTTNTFIPTDGSNPMAAGVNVGQFVSIYGDGASVAVYIARITAINPGANGSIVVSATAVYGTAPVTSATARSIKVGGAWLGPSGASTFPWALIGAFANLTNQNSDHVRLNMKNDQTYALTTSLSFGQATNGNYILQGFTTIPGDGGKATFSTNYTAAVQFNIGTGSNTLLIDLIFQNTSSSGNMDLFQSQTSGYVFIRCVFRGSRQSGFMTNSGGTAILIECEAYDCCKNNISGDSGGFASNGNSAALICYNCYSHDHLSGLNSHCYVVATSSFGVWLFNCIADNATGNGVNIVGGNNSGSLVAINSNFYNIAGDAIKFGGASQQAPAFITNNNFVKIGGRAINNTTTGQTGMLYNNGRVDVNTPDRLGCIIDMGTDFAYPPGTTPWVSPATGNFSTILTQALGVGRGAFTQVDGVNSGTRSYPDIGAAQAQPTTQAWANSEIQTLPYGYVGYFYGWKWTFIQPVAVTLFSGSLPPGLSLQQITPQSIRIVGMPTTVGIYSFVLRTTLDGITGDSPFEITVQEDPDEGVASMILG